MKNVILVLLLFAGISYASAQDVYTSSGKPGYHKKTKKKKGYDPEKLIIGGTLNAGFGGGYANVGVGPLLGYRITDHFSAGVGLGYQYYQEPEYNIDPVDPYKVYYIKENIVYPSIWTRYYVYRNFFVSGTFEFDVISLKGPGYDHMGNFTTLKENVTNPCALIGAGFRQPLGGRVSAYFELIYDVLQGQYSPYPAGSPDIRIGFGAGF
jgi:hypothetical protein